MSISCISLRIEASKFKNFWELHNCKSWFLKAGREIIKTFNMFMSMCFWWLSFCLHVFLCLIHPLQFAWTQTQSVIIMLFFYLLLVFLLCYTLKQNPPVQDIGLPFFMDMYFTCFVILLIKAILQHSNRGHCCLWKGPVMKNQNN